MTKIIKGVVGGGVDNRPSRSEYGRLVSINQRASETVLSHEEYRQWIQQLSAGL